MALDIVNQLPVNASDFFHRLTVNNSKEWFQEHREEYDNSILEPSRHFVMAMGERFIELSSGIVADPRVNRSLFRINRDTRFSKDKSPYKNHLGILFWEGERPKMENSGF